MGKLFESVHRPSSWFIELLCMFFIILFLSWDLYSAFL